MLVVLVRYGQRWIDIGSGIIEMVMSVGYVVRQTCV